MAKINQKAPKSIQINENISFIYWNQHEWEFNIDHQNISKEKAERYQALAMMLTMQFSGKAIPTSRLSSFIGMFQQVFAL